MGNEFNKTEADFVYERYTKMGGISPEEDIPLEELRPLGTITEQSASNKTDADTSYPLESAFASHRPVGETPVDFDGVVDDGSDPALVGDSILAADIGLNSAEPSLGRRADRNGGVLASPPPERDEILESDALLAAGTAGLTSGVIDYAEEDELLEDEEEEYPLEDVPDADEINPGSAIDPVSPPVDVLHGTDLLNGSTGEED